MSLYSDILALFNIAPPSPYINPAQVAATNWSNTLTPYVRPSVFASYIATLGQSIPNGNTPITVNFDTKAYDTANAVTTGASWVFTAPNTGYYRVTSIILYDAQVFTALNVLRLGLAVNGTTTNKPVLSRQPVMVTSTFDFCLNGSATVFLNAGDTVSVWTYHGESAARTLIANAYSSQIFIEQVG